MERFPAIIPPERPPAVVPAAGELAVENGVIYHGLLTGKIVGAISAANAGPRGQWEPILQAHAKIVMPEDARRMLIYDCFVSAIQGMVAFGLTMPFGGADGLRHASIVTLEGSNPVNYLYHEAAHLHLREGRISADEFAFYRDPATVAQLGERYELDRYPSARRPEEALAHICGEWGGGSDNGPGRIVLPPGLADAGGSSDGRRAASAGEPRTGDRLTPDRAEIVQALGLPYAAVRFLDAMVAGDIGRRPVDRHARLAWLQEMGVRPSNEHLFGRHPSELGLARSGTELVRDALEEFKGWRRRSDRDRAAEQLHLIATQLGDAGVSLLRPSLSPEDITAWDKAQRIGRAREADRER